jgi:hypothetical protein
MIGFQAIGFNLLANSSDKIESVFMGAIPVCVQTLSEPRNPLAA